MAELRIMTLALCACVCACAESRFLADPTALDGIPLAEQERESPTPPVDTFWLQQAVSEATRPPPRPVRSISLGYIGDGPLAGGVMRDTPPSYVESTQTAPCSCAARPTIVATE